MMSKNFTRALAGVLTAAFVASSFAPAFAQNKDRGNRDVYIENYYKVNKNARGANEWQRNRHRWSDREYAHWYRNNHRNQDDVVAAGLFGLAAGAIIGGAAASAAAASEPTVVVVPDASGYVAGTEAWLQYCSDRYRSFDPQSGTFLGYDGMRHDCR